jgi:hypothetical protein
VTKKVMSLCVSAPLTWKRQDAVTVPKSSPVIVGLLNLRLIETSNANVSFFDLRYYSQQSVQVPVGVRAVRARHDLVFRE